MVEAASTLPAPHDPTVEDLAEAAREAGLDPAVVRRAAAITPVPDTGLAALLFGAEESIRVRGSLFAPMPERRQTLVQTVEDALGSSGEVVESDPNRFVWKGVRTLIRDSVSIRKEEGSLTLEVQSDRMGRYLLFWGVAFVTLGTISSQFEGLAMLGALNPLLVLVAPALLPVLLARPFWRRAQRRACRRIELLAMEIARLIEEDPASRTGGGVGEEPEP